MIEEKSVDDMSMGGEDNNVQKRQIIPNNRKEQFVKKYKLLSARERKLLNTNIEHVREDRVKLSMQIVKTMWFVQTQKALAASSNSADAAAKNFGMSGGNKKQHI